LPFAAVVRSRFDAEPVPPPCGGASMPNPRQAQHSRRLVQGIGAPHDLRRLAARAVAPMLAASTQ